MTAVDRVAAALEQARTAARARRRAHDVYIAAIVAAAAAGASQRAIAAAIGTSQANVQEILRLERP